MFLRAFGNTRGGQSDWAIRVDATETGCSGEAREHACHAVHDQSFSEIKILLMKFHGQNAHKTKSYVL